METTDLCEIIKLHGNAIYGFCHRLAKDKADTDDLYQETFLKAVERCQKIEKDNNPKGFLISIAIGIWKNKRRKYAWRQRIAPDQELGEDANYDAIYKDESTPEDVMISNELRQVVRNAAEGLSDKLRIPLYMYYTAEMTMEEIASALKIPLGTVKSRLYKARKEMKHILEVSNYEKF